MIVIPMAGLSSRFTKAGYNVPKYMLPLQGRSVFWHSLISFQRYFTAERFIFIARDVQNTSSFIREEIESLKIKEYEIILIDGETAGQAETVEIGLKKSGEGMDEPLTIFNIDSFRKNFSFPSGVSWFSRSSGYLEVFRGEGTNWSYVKPIEGVHEPLVERTTEKDPISDLCSNGLYFFSRAEDFLSSLEKERFKPTAKELYIAPLYNHLIHSGKRIHFNLISKEATVFCGVPQEYVDLGGKKI